MINVILGNKFNNKIDKIIGVAVVRTMKINNIDY
jgi:hypothetical protein